MNNELMKKKEKKDFSLLLLKLKILNWNENNTKKKTEHMKKVKELNLIKEEKKNSLFKKIIGVKKNKEG